MMTIQNLLSTIKFSSLINFDVNKWHRFIVMRPFYQQISAIISKQKLCHLIHMACLLQNQVVFQFIFAFKKKSMKLHSPQITVI